MNLWHWFRLIALLVFGVLVLAFAPRVLATEPEPEPTETTYEVYTGPNDSTWASGTDTNPDGSTWVEAEYCSGTECAQLDYCILNCEPTTTEDGREFEPVTQPAPPQCLSFSANPTTIIQGQSSTLSWTTSGATSARIDPGVGSVAISGSTSVSPPSTTTYVMTASNSDGSCSLQVTVTVLGVPSITKGACPANALLGDTFSFTLSYGNASLATISDTLPGSWNYIGSSPSPSTISGKTLTWNGVGGSGTIGVTVQAVSSGVATNTATITNPGVPSVSSSCTVTTQAGVTIRGDVTAGTGINRIIVYGPSVVTAGSTINITTSGAVFQLQSYLQSLKAQWRETIDQNVNRLLAERARVYGSNTLSSGNINPNSRLDGEVWRVSGDFRVPNGGVTVSGRATFIVENGSLIFDGSLNLGTGTSIVGFVVRNGSVIIGTGAGAVNAAAYAPNGTVSVVGGTVSSLSVTGALIGNSFSFGDRNVLITYDQKISLTPPPGFINLQAPIFQEVAP